MAAGRRGASPHLTSPGFPVGAAPQAFPWPACFPLKGCLERLRFATAVVLSISNRARDLFPLGPDRPLV